MIWRLVIFDVPDRLSGLLARLGFRPTRKNQSHWWRVFDPTTEKEPAEIARRELLAAGLKGKWSRVEATQRSASGARPTSLSRTPNPSYRPKSFRGHTDFSVPNVHNGSWRMRKRRS